MPISVTCQCGAKLEIDEKFLGKEVPCPDCQRPLPTKAPPAPPPLDLPDYRRTSGLAVLSLTLALAGAFTIIGTIAAIVVGVFALREIAAKSKKLEGMGYARAGIAVGATFTFITLAALASPYVFGLDALLRQLALAGRVQYPPEKTISSMNGAKKGDVELTRPSSQWGSYIFPNLNNSNVDIDDLILINIDEDAYIACQTVTFDGGAPDNEDEKLTKILERFYKSELVNLLGRLNGKPLGRTGEVIENRLVKGDKMREVTLDIHLGVPRRILLEFDAKERNELTLLVGATRKSRFERLSDDFKKTFDSFKNK